MEIPDIRRKRASRSRAVATPGKLAGGVALVGAVLFGGYTASSSLGPVADPAAGGAATRLSEVAKADYAAALGSMTDRNQIGAALNQDSKTCPLHLAYVTIQRDPDAPAVATNDPQSVRIVSGNYLSPKFALGDVPQRVAIPYPGPFSAGQGVLRVISTGNAAVSLLPSWHVTPGGDSSLLVTWTPGPDCEGPF